MPEPGNPQAFNRYSYVYNNPLRHTDSSGHCIDGVSTWACLAAAGALVLKGIDYGWTLYDGWQASRTLADPNAARGDKLMAGLNLGMAAIFEAVEPDELLPVGLPLDDAARRAVMSGAKEAYDAGGDEALERYIRENLGDHADEVLDRIGLGVPSNIAYGHAADNLDDFAAIGIDNVDDLADFVDDIIDFPHLSKTNLSNGREAYWVFDEGDDYFGTLVIKDPNHVDGGTIFRPDIGVDYFHDRVK